MKKRGIFLVACFLFIILSFSLISAGWFGRMTGSAVAKTSENSTNECVDSDNGSYYVQGIRIFNGVENEDFCVAEDAVSMNSPSEEGIYVYEYYCEGEGVYLCPFGCEDGACIEETNPSNDTFICDDSDGGIVYGIKGLTSLLNESFEDVCVVIGNSSMVAKSSNSDNLKEFYCGNDSIKFVYHNCAFGCSNGVCLYLNNSNSSFVNCTETDDFKDFYVKGITTCSEGVFEDKCLSGQKTKDSLGPYLLEYFCDGEDYFGNQTYICPHGCYDGACAYSPRENIDNKSFSENQKPTQNTEEERGIQKRTTFWNRVGNFFSRIFKKSSRTQEKIYVFPQDCEILEGAKVFGSEDLCYTGNSANTGNPPCETEFCSVIASSGGMVFAAQNEGCKCKEGKTCITECGGVAGDCTESDCQCCICESYSGAGTYENYQCYEGTSQAGNVNPSV